MTWSILKPWHVFYKNLPRFVPDSQFKLEYWLHILITKCFSLWRILLSWNDKAIPYFIFAHFGMCFNHLKPEAIFSITICSGSDVTQTALVCHLGEIWNKVDIFWLLKILSLDHPNSYKMRLLEKRRHCPTPAHNLDRTDEPRTSCLIPWQPGKWLRRLLYLLLKRDNRTFYEIVLRNLTSSRKKEPGY